LSPDTRQHRGAHPADKRLFSEDQLPLLRTATVELSWLLSRGYQMKSSLKLVGDRYGLTERQRLAVCRAACPDTSLRRRKEQCVAIEEIRNEQILVDGFNLIITIEAALSGGVLIACRDQSIRDLASVHGSYRSVQETERAISLVGAELEKLGPAAVTWLLDRPISNSGRLARKIEEIATENGWPWKVRLVFNPDTEIISSPQIAITSDSSILDRVERWTNLKTYLVAQRLSESWLLDLGNN
jgi:hypothetical protein